MFRVLVLRSSTPVLPVVSEATHFAPSGREAREQIRELLLPERSVQAARAVAHLGVEGNGSSLTMHVMTNPKLSIGKLIRLISRHGKTGVVEHAMYSVLSKLNDSMKEKRAELDASVTQESDFLDWQTKRQHMSIVDHLERQLKILSPYIEIKQVRKSGKMYNVPVPIATEARRRSLILRWMVQNIRSHPQTSLERQLFFEISELRTYRSPLFKKILSVYETAYANRAYTHFRF